MTKDRSNLDSELVDEIIFTNKTLHRKYKEEEIPQVVKVKQATGTSLSSTPTVNCYLKLKMLSVENKPPAFNNLMSKETLHMYIFVQVTLTWNR